MPEDYPGEGARFRFHVPWLTLLVAVAIPLITFYYASLPIALQASNSIQWLTSPFNITQEMAGVGFYYNYVLLVVVFLMVELYSRNIAKLRDKDFIMDNALIISAFSSYVTSAIVWFVTGRPSMGTSVLGFNIFIFFAIDLIDSEFLIRVPSDRKKPGLILAIATIAFVALLVDAAGLLYVYIDSNQFWYVHLLGGAIFIQFFLIYLWFIRYSVDKLEEEIEEDVFRAYLGIENKVSTAAKRASAKRNRNQNQQSISADRQPRQ